MRQLKGSLPAALVRGGVYMITLRLFDLVSLGGFEPPTSSLLVETRGRLTKVREVNELQVNGCGRLEETRLLSFSVVNSSCLPLA